MTRTRIKLCGLTREADVAAAVQAGADAVGFVLYARSARHVTLARAAELARGLPPFVTPVLLFVNAARADVAADWSLVPSTVARSRLVLSGGLNPANVIDGVLALRPYAVDVSSGVEASKGIKDAALMRRFCEAVREADARLADAAT